MQISSTGGPAADGPRNLGNTTCKTLPLPCVSAAFLAKILAKDLRILIRLCISTTLPYQKPKSVNPKG